MSLARDRATGPVRRARLAPDGVNQEVRSSDIHLGRLARAEPEHKQSGGLFVPGEGPGHWPGAACKAGRVM